MNSKIIIASGPVIVEDNKVLLNKSGDDDFWKFCGGKIGDSENLIETAQRRIKEEMGLEIKIINREAFLMYTKKPGEPEIDVILAHFLAEKINRVAPGEMVKEWEWFAIDNLPDNLAPNIKPTLKHFGFIS